MEEFAAAPYTPFGYFFLAAPPEEPLPIPDFRTLRPEGLRRPSGNLLDTVYLCQQRQAWFEDFAGEERLEPVGLVGCHARHAWGRAPHLVRMATYGCVGAVVRGETIDSSVSLSNCSDV